jgi:hypothetical protein
MYCMISFAGDGVFFCGWGWGDDCCRGQLYDRGLPSIGLDDMGLGDNGLPSAHVPFCSICSSILSGCVLLFRSCLAAWSLMRGRVLFIMRGVAWSRDLYALTMRVLNTEA